MRPVRFPSLLLACLTMGAVANIACVERDDRFNNLPASESDADADADADTDTDTDADADADTDTDTDTDTDPAEDLDDPGDVVTFNTGDDSVDLGDVGGESNQGQSFFLIVVNEGDSGAGFNLRYTDATLEDEEEAEDTGSSGPVQTPTQKTTPPKGKRSPGPDWTPLTHVAPPSGEPEVGVSRQSFRVRNDFNSDGNYAKITATLWGLG
jgi:hypothetical protein